MECFPLFQTSGPASSVRLDGANGVGAEKVRRLMRHIDSTVLTVEVLNDGSCGTLNEKVGVIDCARHQLGSPPFSHGLPLEWDLMPGLPPLPLLTYHFHPLIPHFSLPFLWLHCHSAVLTMLRAVRRLL